jgi:histidinol phosphatase-like enzyme
LRTIFVQQDCLVFPQSAQEAEPNVQLRPGVAEGLQVLADAGLFIIALFPGVCVDAESSLPAYQAMTQHMLEAIRQNKGQVDAVLQCPHRLEDHCDCWGSYPGFLYYAASQLELRLDECYLLCTEPSDVLLAYTVGCRPILILDGHSIAQLYGEHQPEPHDFPIARNFRSAVQYVLAEEEGNEIWGHPRPASAFAQLDEDLVPTPEVPEFSPTLRLLSSVPGAKWTLLSSLPQVSRSAKQWLVLFIFGGVWLSLGIAYILTHLYRVQPFPEFVWYLTLQFIPRPMRGLLFIVTGVVVVIVSMRAFLRLFPNGSRRQ